jgi:transposase InsO family protein
MISVSQFCSRAQISRQAYYKQHRERQKQVILEDQVIHLVKTIRSQHPRVGVRKLMVMLRQAFRDAGISIGRDRLFDVLRGHDLLIKRRRRGTRTTQSRHCFYKYPNRIKGMAVLGRNQVWVSDVTYLRTREGFLYLSMITDTYSRKIVGYAVNDTLEVEGCILALKMALKGCRAGEYPIHHSDRGIQYCCRAYIERLQKSKCAISMTEEDHCAENAMAERMNGILKEEYLRGIRFATKAQAIRSVHQAIWLYNNERPHMALGYGIPGKIHEAA